jgi:hypothetical protein
MTTTLDKIKRIHEQHRDQQQASLAKEYALYASYVRAAATDGELCPEHVIEICARLGIDPEKFQDDAELLAKRIAAAAVVADAASRNQAAAKIEQRQVARADDYTRRRRALDQEYEQGKQEDIANLNTAMAAAAQVQPAEDFLRSSFDEPAALAREKELTDMAVRVVAKMRPLENEINPAGREDGRFPTLGNRLAGVQQSIADAKQNGGVSTDQITRWQSDERGLQSQLAQVQQRLASLRSELASVNQEAREISIRKLKA